MDRFTKITISVIVSLLILIALFLYLGSFRKNHVRNIQVTGSQENASFIDPRIDIVFSRPVRRDNIKDFISITPNVEFSVVFIRNDLQISFLNNLDSNTDYSLRISRELKDVYNETLESDFIFNFKTKEQRVTFIEIEESLDKIVESDLKFETKTILFESDSIKTFRRNSNYLVVVVFNSDRTQNIILKNLNTNSSVDFKLDKQTIYSIDISDEWVIFVAQKVELRSNFLAPQGNSTINLYNIDSGELKLFNPKNTGVNSLFAEFSSDNQNIIFKSQDSFYYLSGIYDDQNLIAIGRFKTYGGFNKDLNQIVFTEFDPLQTYSSFPFVSIFTSEREIKKITDGEFSIVDPKFFYNSNDVIFSQQFKDLEGSTGFYRIMRYNGSESTEVLRDEFNSLELPQVSYDDKYLVAERYSSFDLLDFGNHRDFIDYIKPLYGDLVSYDLVSGEILGECINCIEAIFNE